MGSNLTCDGHRRFPYTATQKKIEKQGKILTIRGIFFGGGRPVLVVQQRLEIYGRTLTREEGEKIASR